MNCNLPKITYPVIRTLLLSKLYDAIYHPTDVTVKKVSTDIHQNDLDTSNVKLPLKSIQLKQVRNETFTIVYQSAIALQFSSVLRRNSLELVYQILNEFQQEDVNFCQAAPTTAQCILSNFTSKAVSPGLLQFELGDRGLSSWLQCLMDSPLLDNSSKPISRLTPLKPFVQSSEGSEQLFVCQYSHARCCSLLRLAHESVITLNSLEINTLGGRWRVLTPDPIPWLTTQGQLCLIHPTERALISQLVTIIDDLSNLMTTPQLCLRAALTLSHSFQNFYQACQIFKSASPASLERSQSRLGLVIATQQLLRHLLEAGLNAKAPSEL